VAAGNRTPVQSFCRYPDNFASSNRDPSPCPSSLEQGRGSGARTILFGSLNIVCLRRAQTSSFGFPNKNSGKVCSSFSKLAEHEAEPRTNARPSGLATVLQNREAMLLDFGQSQYFPIVGKCCALSLRAPEAGARFFYRVFVLSAGACR
jgi:hypothetical protein